MSTVVAPPAPSEKQPPSPNSLGGPKIRFQRMVAATLTSRAVLRPGFALLRHVAPVLKAGKRVVVSRHRDVVEVLGRDGDFTISQINGPSIDRINGPFILNMDRGPEFTYDRDHAALRAASRREDLDRVRALVRDTAARLVDAARPQKRIEAVQGLTRATAATVVEEYYGVPGPDRATLVRWMRNLFQDAFSNPNNDPFVRAAALQTRKELEAWILPYIARRRQEGVQDAQDVLGRLIAFQSPERPWADDDWVRRNIAGLIVGAVDTTSRFSILTIDELLRRPEELAGAQRAAQAGDIDLVRQYAWEAVRFNPHTPLMARFSAKDQVIAAGTEHEHRVPAGSTLVLGTLSAMFDADGFPEPDRFRTDRPIDSYLHFGWGLHQCFGLAVNKVQVPEIVAALLRLPGLRRAPGADGHVQLDGPFPNRLVLEFD